MKYIIMCGGDYDRFKLPKHLQKVNGEVIVERTIRLLKENGITDISISTNNPAFDYLDVPKLRHNNPYVYRQDGTEGYWVDAFYPTKEPTCYIFGDVYFSEAAIEKIIKTSTKDIELFGSTPPFAKNYCKSWVEPFALKVVNTKHLKEAIEETKELARQGKTWRKNPIMWELWTVIKNEPLQTEAGKYKYNYTAINDYTTDVDDQKDINQIENFIKIGGEEMIKVEVVEEFTLGDFYKVKETLKRKAKEKEGKLFVGDTFECDENLLRYLTGGNPYGKAFVKVIEVIPELEEPVERIGYARVVENVEEKVKEKSGFSKIVKPSLKVTKRDPEVKRGRKRK